MRTAKIGPDLRLRKSKLTGPRKVEQSCLGTSSIYDEPGVMSQLQVKLKLTHDFNNLRRKINYVFSRTTRGKRIQQSCLVFQTNMKSNYNEPGETDLRAILMTF